jgi:hypothetical protein
MLLLSAESCCRCDDVAGVAWSTRRRRSKGEVVQGSGAPPAPDDDGSFCAHAGAMRKLLFFCPKRDRPFLPLSLNMNIPPHADPSNLKKDRMENC